MNSFGVQYLNRLSGISLGKSDVLQESNKEISEIIETLRQLKDGYAKRDIESVDNFVEELFIKSDDTYILGTGTGELSLGIEEVRTLLRDDWEYWGDVNIDLEHAITSKRGEVSWVTVCGLLKGKLTEDELYARALEELENLFQSDISPKDKLFAIHRSIAYLLKESAMGQDYTCPIRLTAVVTNQMGGPVFQNIHFSFPFCWIFEGKLDSI